jgi:hypothetical protein
MDIIAVMYMTEEFQAMSQHAGVMPCCMREDTQRHLGVLVTTLMVLCGIMLGQKPKKKLHKSASASGHFLKILQSKHLQK